MKKFQPLCQLRQRVEDLQNYKNYNVALDCTWQVAG
jgi:hypothetical protein